MPVPVYTSRAVLLAVALAVSQPAASADALSNACAQRLDREFRAIAPAGEHPLLGRMLVFDRSQGSTGAATAVPVNATGEALLAAAKWTAADFVLLGEIHDNPFHHRLRAAMMGAWRCVKPSRGGTAVFEHIRADQSDAIAGPPSEPDQAAAALLDRLAWGKSGWPDAAMFRPLLAAVYAARLDIRAGEPPQGRARQVARQGLPALAIDEISRLGLARSFDAPLAEALAEELNSGHCGMLPDAAIPALALSQRYRDAHLARAMLDAARSDATVFLIAGNGHVRSDRGVPWHLAGANPGLRTVTFSLVEVQEDRIDPGGYVPRDPAGEPAADVVIFTPRAPRGDPCDRMKASPPRN